MANGDNLPYQTLDVVPFTPITSAWGDGIGADILALAAGTGFDDGVVGKIVQEVSTVFSSFATGTTTIPYDDTIPQNTEGTEFMTQSITPNSASNILQIQALAAVSVSSGVAIISALFQDSAANALAAMSNSLPTALINTMTPLPISHKMTAGTTSATTFKIRIGGNGASTVTFNGSSGARLFGTITKSWIKITEYKA